jgi:hypothetical protein
VDQLLADHLKRMSLALRASAEGHLGWGYRLRLWGLIDAAFPNDAELRYCALAHLTLAGVSVVWQAQSLSASAPIAMRLSLSDFPQGVLASFAAAIFGHEASIERLVTWRKALVGSCFDDYISDLASAALLAATLQATSRVQFPRARAYTREVIDDLLDGADIDQEEVMSSFDDLDYDPLSCDYEYWGAYIDSVREDQSHDIERRRQFWENWVRVLVPLAIGPVEELKEHSLRQEM